MSWMQISLNQHLFEKWAGNNFIQLCAFQMCCSNLNIAMICRLCCIIHKHLPIYIYIYIYIYSHPQTDCFVLSELFSVARHAGRSEPGSKPVQLYGPRWLREFKGIFIFLETAAAAFVYIFSYTLSATNSFEELLITLAAAGNSFAESSTPIEEHILSSTDRLFRSIRTLQCG